MKFEAGDLLTGVLMLALAGILLAWIFAVFGVWEPQLVGDLKEAHERPAEPSKTRYYEEPAIWIDPLTECHWLVSGAGSHALVARTDFKGRHICFEEPGNAG